METNLSALPPPFTDPAADLRGMPYMPLDLHRLFESDFYALASGEEFKAALTLWGKSFYQIPAGSLPADERLLAHLSGAKCWENVKEMALHGWVKCADGRLYHATVAEKVAEAWQARLTRRARTQAARAAKLKALEDDEAQPEPVTKPVTEPVTGSKGTEQKGTEQKGREEKDIIIAPERFVCVPTEFEQFWQLYPRRVGKGQARRAFATALKKTTLPVLLAALQAYVFDPRERFQPHPATWLNGERWLDEHTQQDPVLRAAGVNQSFEKTPENIMSLLQ